MKGSLWDWGSLGDCREIRRAEAEVRQEHIEHFKITQNCGQPQILFLKLSWPSIKS